MRFPVIYFRGDEMGAISSIQALTSGTWFGSGRRWLRGLHIVDSDGISHKVRDAVVVGPTGGLLRRIGGLVFPLVKYDLIMEQEPSGISLDDFKDLVCNTFDLDPEFWESGGDLDDLKDAVRWAKSFEEIIVSLY